LSRYWLDNRFRDESSFLRDERQGRMNHNTTILIRISGAEAEAVFEGGRLWVDQGRQIESLRAGGYSLIW
jgi:hypothetical protein